MKYGLDDSSEEKLHAEARVVMENAFFSKRDRCLVATRECVGCGVYFEDEVYEALKDVYDEKLPFCLMCDSTDKALALVTPRP